jgi:predicted nucleic acid-binding protein
VAVRPLILDSEAVSALAHGPVSRRRIVAAALTAARREGAEVVVSAAVLAELYRGPRFDAAVDSVLARDVLVVRDVTRRVARIAGSLLARARMDSAHAIDAFVVSVAYEVGGGVILTGDADDLARLAGAHPSIEVASI